MPIKVAKEGALTLRVRWQRKNQEQDGEESDGKGSEDTPNKGGSSQHTLTLEGLGIFVEMILKSGRD